MADPATQAGTDRDALKEQARQAMLRASEAVDGSMDAELEDDEQDEADPTADDAAAPDTDEDEDADEADESDDDDGGADEEADDDDLVADGPPPSDKKRKRGRGKVARLHETIERLEARLAERDQDVDTRIEEALAAKAVADQKLADIRRQQAEDGKRAQQVRSYFAELRGSDADLKKLTYEMANTKPPSPLDEAASQTYVNKQARLAQMLSAREIVDLAVEFADNDLRDNVGGILASFSDLPGVEKGFHDRFNFHDSVQHLYDAGLAQGKLEGEKQIAKLQKQIANIEGKLSESKLKRKAPLDRVPEGGTSVARPPAKPRRAEDMTPKERLEELGAIGKDGRIDPAFRKKLKMGLVSLAG